MDANGPSQGKKNALNRNRRATYCLGKIRLYLGKLGIEGNSVLLEMEIESLNILHLDGLLGTKMLE